MHQLYILNALHLTSVLGALVNVTRARQTASARSDLEHIRLQIRALGVPEL